MTYLVDTNILINALNGRQGDSEPLHTLVALPFRVCPEGNLLVLT